MRTNNKDFFSLSTPVFAIIGSLLAGILYILICYIININIRDIELFISALIGFILGNVVRIKFKAGDHK